MELHLKTIGCLLIGLAIIHIVFPKYFNWKEELKPLSLMNQQMMVIHTFFVALVVFLMGILCLTSASEIIETHLGNKIALGFGVFWTIRLVLQFFGYSSQLWKGKTFETIVHIVFSIFWLYLSGVFWMVFFNSSIS
jgi:hypothetical protein